VVPLDVALERRTMALIPDISDHGSLQPRLCCELGFRYQSAPDQAGRERNVGPLDHVRYIPFIKQLCSHPTLSSISINIQNCSNYFFHVVFTSCLETLVICNLRMRSFKTTYFKVQCYFDISRFSAISKSYDYFVIKQIIWLQIVWLQTELDSTQPYYHC